MTPRTPSGVALFWWVRWRQARAAATEVTHSPMKLAVIVSVWAILLIGIYALCQRGIQFIYETAGLGPFLLSRLWFLFLFVVLILLTVSQFTGLYATLMRAPETRWWMSLPVSGRTIGRIKWIESSLYSSWAVAILVIPMLLADIVVIHQPLWLVAWAVLALFVPLIIFATATATVLFLAWLRWFGWVAVRRELVPFAFVIVCGVLFWLLGEQRGVGQHEDAWFVALQELLPRMKLATASWLPSRWVATALDASLNGRWVESGVYTALLWSTALLAWRLLDHVAGWKLLELLRNHPQTLEGSAQAEPNPLSGTASLRVRWWMRHPWSAAMAKDVLLTLRDPAQWSQAVVFFGLLGVYFANIHHLAAMSVEPSWRIGVASLNLACSLLVFGSLTVRFLFPQMSLEGRSLWLLRLAPHGMRRLLMAKLCLYGVLGTLIIEGLVALSMSRLGIPIAIRWWMAAVGVCGALTLVSLTVGLGAWWIDPTVQDGARFISSSTGAVVLVLMLGYVGCVVMALIVAWRGWYQHQHSLVWMATGSLIGTSLVASLVPLRGGLHTLEQLEWQS